MFGTIARMRVQVGHEEEFLKASQENEASAREVPGFVAAYVFKTERDAREYVLVAIFRDRETYRANAADPQQDRSYRQWRQHLEADPEWIDGEVVYAEMGEPAGS